MAPRKALPVSPGGLRMALSRTRRVRALSGPFAIGPGPVAPRRLGCAAWRGPPADLPAPSCGRRTGLRRRRSGSSQVQRVNIRLKGWGLRRRRSGPSQVHSHYLVEIHHETSRPDLFVAIDRVMRRLFRRVFKARTAANAQGAGPIRPRTVLTGNGRESTVPFFDPRKRDPSDRHEGDRPCAGSGAERRPRRAATAVSARGRNRIMADPAKSWKPRRSAMSGMATGDPRTRPPTPGRPCRRWRIGTNRKPQPFGKRPCAPRGR